MHKNCFAALTAVLLSFTLCACGSKPAQNVPTEPVTESGVTEAPPETDAPTEAETTAEDPAAGSAALNAIPDALMNTVLTGVNGTEGAFALKFEGDKALFRDQSGTALEEYWALDGGMLHLYSDEAKTAESRAVAFDYNDVKNVLRLDGRVYMADTGKDSLDDEAGKLAAAADAYAQLRGRYWGGGDSAYALIFMLNEDGSCDMHYYDGSDGVIDEATFYWAMGGDTIFFYNEDFAPVMHFSWRMDGPSLMLSDAATGNTIACKALTDEESSEVSRQLGVLAGAYGADGEDAGGAVDNGNYEDFDISVD